MLDTYTNLQVEIADYLARDDLNLKIPTFIALCEAKLNRELYVRQMEQRSTVIIDTTSAEPEFISLPDDFQSMRSIRLKSTNLRSRLEFKTGVAMDEHQTQIGNVSGEPRYFTIVGDEIELSPAPDDAYTIEMVYRKTIPSLVDNDTNWLLTLAPDVYLYGALLEATPYTKDDNRIQVWAAGFSSALDSLNRLGMASSFNAGPLQIQVSGTTP
jgi:hypothetical protein